MRHNIKPSPNNFLLYTYVPSALINHYLKNFLLQKRAIERHRERQSLGSSFLKKKSILASLKAQLLLPKRGRKDLKAQGKHKTIKQTNKQKQKRKPTKNLFLVQLDTSTYKFTTVETV